MKTFLPTPTIPIRNFLLAALVAGHCGFGSVAAAAAASSPSELLEQGIYSEETKGDVDAAIAIYQQLLTEAKAGQSFAAQAQYRLALCLQKKNRTAEATAAFEKLIKDFPDEKELVSKARAHLPSEMALIPVPWVDGEREQLTLTLGTGLVIGTMEMRANLVDVGGKKAWQVGRRMTGGGDMISRVEVDAETFKPLTSYWKHTLIGEATAVFKGDEVTVTTAASPEPKKIPLEKTTYDNEECMHLMRRLPLEVGYKTAMPIMASLGGGSIIPMVLEVTAKEMVEVPAGKFECFKVELNIRQTFWYSSDAHHYLVKFEAGGAIGSMASVTQRAAGAAVAFRDDALGVSLTAPADWVVFRLKGHSGKKEFIGLCDPNGDLDDSTLALVQTSSLSTVERQSSRAWAETDFKDNVSKELKNVKIRPESWKNVTINGRPGVSYVADYVADGDKPRVGFAMRVLGTNSSEAFNFTCPPDKFDGAKAAFDSIIASYRMTK